MERVADSRDDPDAESAQRGPIAGATLYRVRFDLRPNSLPVTVSVLGRPTRRHLGGFRGRWISARPPGFSATFEAYCIDLEHRNPSSSTYGVWVSTTGSLGRVAWLYMSYAHEGAEDPVRGAALQLALWDVLRGSGDDDVSTGSGQEFRTLRASRAVVERANAYLKASRGRESTACWLHAQHQGMMYQDMVAPPGGRSIPPPPPTVRPHVGLPPVTQRPPKTLRPPETPRAGFRPPTEVPPRPMTYRVLEVPEPDRSAPPPTPGDYPTIAYVPPVTDIDVVPPPAPPSGEFTPPFDEVEPPPPGTGPVPPPPGGLVPLVIIPGVVGLITDDPPMKPESVPEPTGPLPAVAGLLPLLLLMRRRKRPR